jgi:hypothetical protein
MKQIVAITSEKTINTIVPLTYKNGEDIVAFAGFFWGKEAEIVKSYPSFMFISEPLEDEEINVWLSDNKLKRFVEIENI